MTSMELGIIIPTYNERLNIRLLLQRIEKVLAGVTWEVIFVDDDSPDGTADEVRQIARDNIRVRCIQRIGRRGLSSACIEGMASSSALHLAVMDADMQHDESLLAQMLVRLQSGDCDLVVGSRYVTGGSVGDWSRVRKGISHAATILGRRLMRCELSDPMSGFFMLKREVFWNCARNLSGRGFKILLDLITSTPDRLRVVELPFTFRQRHAGMSKLDTSVALEYGVLLVDKLIGWFLPLRFILFVSVGSIGAILHVSILGFLHKVADREFIVAQAIASLSAMVLNYFFNNLVTYRDLRLRGIELAKGILLFILICSIGAFTNVQIAAFLFEHSVPWWMAGLLGAMVGSVWNFAVSSQFVWRRSQRRPRQGRSLTVETT